MDKRQQFLFEFYSLPDFQAQLPLTPLFINMPGQHSDLIMKCLSLRQPDGITIDADRNCPLKSVSVGYCE